MSHLDCCVKLKDMKILFVVIYDMGLSGLWVLHKIMKKRNQLLTV